MVVYPVIKSIEAEAGRGIVIPITENLALDYHKDLSKAAGITRLSAWLLITLPRSLT